MEQNRPEPRRTLPPAQRRRRHRIRLVRNWTVFLLSCGAMMAVMTGGILWLLPKAYALIAPPTAFEAREYTGGAETDLSDARLVLVNGNLPQMCIRDRPSTTPTRMTSTIESASMPNSVQRRNANTSARQRPKAMQTPYQ